MKGPERPQNMQTLSPPLDSGRVGISTRLGED
jgi:hypothetical protein